MKGTWEGTDVRKLGHQGSLSVQCPGDRSGQKNIHKAISYGLQPIISWCGSGGI